MSGAKYKRVLLKLSGEALEGDLSSGIDPVMLEKTCKQIAEITALGTQVGIVVGGGNLFRGVSKSAKDMNRATADYMGMLATVMNGLAIADQLRRLGLKARVMSSLHIPQVAELFIREKAIAALDAGEVVIFTAGTGNPYFSTDTAAALRAAEIKADIMLKGTKVNGIYDSDPVKNPAAKRFDTITYQEILDKNLKVMDLTAVSICLDSQMPILVFNMKEEGAISAVLCGADKGTTVTV